MSHSDEVATERALMIREIARIVQEAKAAGETIRTGYHVGMLAARYPSANLTLGAIIDELVGAATREGVAVEAGRG